ncbi:MAG: hypothetical protein GY861_04025 [bacterium]|nr:hypothetical protein [bacterium]
MTNIVVTSTADVIKVVFNDQAPGNKTGFYNRNSIVLVECVDNDEFVIVKSSTGDNWALDQSGESGMVVDTINGVPITDNCNLVITLGALIKA